MKANSPEPFIRAHEFDEGEEAGDCQTLRLPCQSLRREGGSILMTFIAGNFWGLVVKLGISSEDSYPSKAVRAKRQEG